jgi:hypothetical protein
VELEDIRGRSFAWTKTKSYPLDVRIDEASKRVGWIKSVGRGIPEFTGHFAGVDWHIKHLEHGNYRGLQISFLNGPVLGFTEQHLLSPSKMILDGIRTYTLRHNSMLVSSWLDEKETEVVVFYRSDTQTDAPKRGEIMIRRQASELDAPPLAAVGLIRALGGHLFIRF